MEQLRANATDRVSRRRFLALSVALLGAANCSPAAPAASPPATSPPIPVAPTQTVALAPSPAASQSPSVNPSAVSASQVTPPADWQQRWDDTVAAAKKEGALILVLQPGDPFQQWLGGFQEKYREISAQASNLTGAQAVARVLVERQAGQYLWDFYIGGPESAQGDFVPPGALDPILPALLLPEVLDDSKWYSGFMDGFTDRAMTYVYNGIADLVPTVYLDRDQVSAADLSTVDALIDANWQGKMSMLDPRVPSKAASDAGHWLLVKGEDWYRSLLKQQPTVTSDRRQQIQWLLANEYPIGISVSNTDLPPFQAQGLGTNVQPLGVDTPLGSHLSNSKAVAIFNRAPHPNAASVFLNWILSVDGQALGSRLIQTNSRRLDVPVASPDTVPDPKVQYAPSINKEAYADYETRAENIAKELLT